MVKSSTILPSTYIKVSDVISYNIAVTNTGNVTLTNVLITDANATITGDSPIATLAPGATGNVTRSEERRVGNEDACRVKQTARSTDTDPNGNTVPGTSNEVVVPATQ